MTPMIVFAPADSEAGAQPEPVDAETPDSAGSTPEGTVQHESEQEPVDWQARAKELEDEVSGWESRYKEAQAWGTRQSQQAKVLEQWYSDDPAERRKAAEALGVELLEDDSPEGEADTEGAGVPAGLDPQTYSEIQYFLESQREMQQQQEQEQAYAAYRQETDQQLEKMGVPQELFDMVADAALELPGVETAQGLQPDLEGAVEQIKEWTLRAAALPGVQQTFLDRYRQSKQAPHMSPGGVAGTEAPDLDAMSLAERHAYMAERLKAAGQ